MNQADLDNSPHLADSHVGDAKYADINKDGIIDADDSYHYRKQLNIKILLGDD